MGSRQEPVSNDLLRRLLTIAAAEPDAERFARAVNAAQRGKMVLDEQAVLMTSLEQVLKSGSIVYIFISQSSIQYMIKYILELYWIKCIQMLYLFVYHLYYVFFY